MNAIEFRLTRDGYAMPEKRKYQRHNWLDILILCSMAASDILARFRSGILALRGEVTGARGRVGDL